MRFETTTLPGAWLVRPEPVTDERGFFERTFCMREYEQHGLQNVFVQHSVSCSLRRGTVRGMHFQRPPHAEVKIVTCLKGAIWDVIIDLRPGSTTFAQWQGFELTEANQHQLYIPAGFAHGMQTLCDTTKVGYLISAFYVADAADGLRHDDPVFGIGWPLAVSSISAKDSNWPDFSAAARPMSVQSAEMQFT